MDAGARSGAGQRRLVRDYSTDAMFYGQSQPAREQRWRSASQDIEPAADIVAMKPSSIPSTLTSRRRESYNLESGHKPDAIIEPPQRMAMSPIEPSYAPSFSTQQTSHSTNSKLADFFSSDVFQIVLHNPTTAHQLKKFSHQRFCGENLDFLDGIDQYQQSVNQLTQTVFDIHKNFISVNAPNQVNLPDEVLLQINKNLKSMLTKTIPGMESMFVSAQSDIEKLVQKDVYPKFVRHQMVTSAAKALATNKNKYAGLGDCFVLTDPSKADNPIVYASDGFVKVTGYERNEIVPRNCRFLQTRHTDRASVRRIKQAVEEPSEHVELLLNARKTGEPFWNLLYTAPLRRAGRVEFFIGGQINISTTIHNTSDILRILSYDEQSEEDKVPIAVQNTKPKQGFFSAFRSKQRSVNTRSTGMEDDLLQDMEHMTFKQQKEAFYTAYSKYLVIHADTMTITHHSSGITDLIFPARSPNGQEVPMLSQDVFRWLAQHASGNFSKEYKISVKSALRVGAAISLDISLNTKRSRGLETFATHWTPLKDDRGAVGYVILMLASVQDTKMYS